MPFTASDSCTSAIAWDQLLTVQSEVARAELRCLSHLKQLICLMCDYVCVFYVCVVWCTCEVCGQHGSLRRVAKQHACTHYMIHPRNMHLDRQCAGAGHACMVCLPRLMHTKLLESWPVRTRYCTLLCPSCHRTACCPQPVDAERPETQPPSVTAGSQIALQANKPVMLAIVPPLGECWCARLWC